MTTGKITRRILIFLLFICASFLEAETKSGIGRIIQLIGDVDLSDINSQMRVVPEIGSQINEDQKIRTGLKSYVEILLNDNTKIFMRELSVIQIGSLRMKSDDPPAKIIFNIGKIRININKRISGRNMVIKTGSAVIGVKDMETDIAVITTNYETKAAVFEGRVDIASSNRDILKFYDLKKKEESGSQLNTPPTEPVILPQEILDYWLDYYDIDDRRIMIKGREDGGIIDYLLRKRKF